MPNATLAAMLFSSSSTGVFSGTIVAIAQPGFANCSSSLSRALCVGKFPFETLNLGNKFLAWNVHRASPTKLLPRGAGTGILDDLIRVAATKIHGLNTPLTAT
jgi:hypothetical protein